jgi:hypothetical protein
VFDQNKKERPPCGALVLLGATVRLHQKTTPSCREHELFERSARSRSHAPILPRIARAVKASANIRVVFPEWKPALTAGTARP